MSTPAEFEARLAAVETHLAQLDVGVAAAVSDAAAARHLAAARDRDLADLTIKVDANRQAINAVGVQAASGFAETRAAVAETRAAVAELRTEMRTKFDLVDAKFDLVDNGFVEMRGRFDQTAAGMAHIIELLTRRDE